MMPNTCLSLIEYNFTCKLHFLSLIAAIFETIITGSEELWCCWFASLHGQLLHCRVTSKSSDIWNIQWLHCTVESPCSLYFWKPFALAMMKRTILSMGSEWMCSRYLLHRDTSLYFLHVMPPFFKGISELMALPQWRSMFQGSRTFLTVHTFLFGIGCLH